MFCTVYSVHEMYKPDGRRQVHSRTDSTCTHHYRRERECERCSERGGNGRRLSSSPREPRPAKRRRLRADREPTARPLYSLHSHSAQYVIQLQYEYSRVQKSTVYCTVLYCRGEENSRGHASNSEQHLQLHVRVKYGDFTVQYAYSVLSILLYYSNDRTQYSAS